LQSQDLGWSYLFKVGIPSLVSAAKKDGNHKYKHFEQDANRRAFMYFNKNVDGFYQTEEQNQANRDAGLRIGWDFDKNPLDVNRIGSNSRRQYLDYYNLEHRDLINTLRLKNVKQPCSCCNSMNCIFKLNGSKL
jgi:hypothetical protein